MDLMCLVHGLGLPNASDEEKGILGRKLQGGK